MKSSFRNFVFSVLAGVTALWAQQDSTVQWKTILQDLEQRLAGLPAGGEAVGAWRADAEALRDSISSFADTSPGLKIQVPEPLPLSPGHQALRNQFDALNAAVNQVIQQTPGTPFNLGQVEVDVTSSIADTSPVTVGIDQSLIANLNLINAAQALDYLPGVSIQHLDTQSQ